LDTLEEEVGQMAKQQNGFREQLHDFALAHGEGWNHHEWLGLLAELTDGGVDTSDPDAIGAALEYERILVFLEQAGIKGLGPKRRVALADRFERLWTLRHATVEQIAEIPSFHRGLAEAVLEALG
jgi:hypothetical protein